MSDTIDSIGSQFKSVADMQAYSDAQYKTIVQLSKKISKLEEENTELKRLLESSTPLIRDPEGVSIIETIKGLPDEEAIAIVELRKLKDTSFERELTLEEAKRTEIYVKILNTVRAKSKDQLNVPKPLDDKELLALLEVDLK